MTKILYLDHPQFDLGCFNLYMGLCEVLGDENVVVFPQKKLYFGQVDDYSGGYSSFLRKLYDKSALALPYGIPPLAPGEDVINGYPNTRELPYFMGRAPHPDYTEDQIVDMVRAGTFSFIVLASSNRVNTIALARIRDKMGGLVNLPPIVYVDNGERDEYNEHWAHVFQPQVKFKLILTPEVYHYIKEKYGWELHCLPQSSCLAGKNLREILIKYYLGLPGGSEGNRGVPDYITFNDQDKCFDLYYAMGGTHGKRFELMNTMKELFVTRGHFSVINAHATYHVYLNYIAHAKAAISMRGSGRDTARYWDIPLFNTLMICDGTMGCMHPNPFEHGKTAVFYDVDNLKSIGEILDYYLNPEHDKERERIARAGKEHLLKYHTNRARAEYFLQIVDKELRQHHV